MFKKIKIKIKNIHSENDRALIETEVDILKGVKDIVVDENNGEAVIGFEDDIISLNKISETIEKLGFEIEDKGKTLPVKKEYTYFVKGMHCASCEILIEKKLSALKEIKSVEASTGKGIVLVVYEGERPSTDRLNKTFEKERSGCRLNPEFFIF